MERRFLAHPGSGRKPLPLTKPFDGREGKIYVMLSRRRGREAEGGGLLNLSTVFSPSPRSLYIYSVHVVLDLRTVIGVPLFVPLDKTALLGRYL